ncbi:hypothetical protein AKJ09_00272 [Labilithrix luteola]|uniref:Uncharacterized protein n=1 Tax=Labilithrix luteola TaxID=1391654 RepID=A0A0K1PJ88_9BACT|nr:hypothetical protein [Labilithrix luteola]AKU93608.1 hypothetical protein AKJ09_00272 [Labilithrix luteola]
MRRPPFVLALLLLTAGCEALLGADFDRSLKDGGSLQGADGSAGGDDGDGTTPGGPKSDGGGGKKDGPSGDGNVPNAGRTPLDIFGAKLRVWLDAGKGAFTAGDGVSIISWNDQSGNAANGHVAGTGGGTIQLGKDQVNGLPAIVFDNDAWVLGDKSPDFGVNEDFYIAVVAAYSTLGPNDRFFFSRWSSMSRGYALYAGRQDNPAVGATLDASGIVMSSTTANTADGAFRVYALRRTAGSNGSAKLEIRVNGASTSAEMPYAPIPTDRPLAFGGAQEPNSVYSRFLVGSIAEIVVVQGTVSDTEAVDVETSLATKYAL